MLEQTARDFLLQDTGAVPCSRYGWDSESCFPVVWACALIFQDANGEEITFELLDHLMGLAVNDHDDIESLIRDHGTSEQIELLED